ncbi:hypothetical protein L596_001607 [Steinernema carpocapsae]|uniref:Uncharacterized protein n=1 Tax=Steinernema carpocapsae TaxID=34508 RepID=A0A4U8UM84_STECR|nr:hypothetical protein L596_001607 [Steinernema carpocapsae]
MSDHYGTLMKKRSTCCDRPNAPPFPIVHYPPEIYPTEIIYHKILPGYTISQKVPLLDNDAPGHRDWRSAESNREHAIDEAKERGINVDKDQNPDKCAVCGKLRSKASKPAHQELPPLKLFSNPYRLLRNRVRPPRRILPKTSEERAREAEEKTKTAASEYEAPFKHLQALNRRSPTDGSSQTD